MSVPTTQPRSEQLVSVQYLRAIAALLVVISHASIEAQQFFKLQPLFPTKAFSNGVDLFFIISGFIIYHSSIKLFDQPGAVATFAKNRIIRVVPLYYLATTLALLIIVFFPSGVNVTGVDWRHVLATYGFIPYPRPFDGQIKPILALGWTLNFEMLFYCIFAFCMLAPKRFVGPLAILVLICFTMARFVLPAGAPPAFFVWTTSIILEFAFGLIIAMLYERYGKLPVPLIWAILLAVVGFALLYYLNTPPKPLPLKRWITAGVPAAMIAFAAIMLLPHRIEAKLPRFGVALGDSSYSLYLAHRFIQRPIQIAVAKFSPFPLEQTGVIYFFTAVIGALAFGHFVYLTVERPLLRWLRGKKARPAEPGERSEPKAPKYAGE